VRKERSELLNATLQALPDRYREVIELRNVQGLSFEEIAVKLNRSSGATRMLWLRAIDAVRKQMNDGEFA
jgi:RNA polymerase sigma-70 factor (ECF subfamily)